MKTRNIILGLLLIFCASFFTGCTDPNKNVVLTSIDPAVLDNLPFQEIAMTSPDNGTNPLLMTVTWTETKFSLDGNVFPAGPVSYILEADRAGNNFANPVTLAASTGLAANLYVNDINNLLLNKFNGTPGVAIPLELRLTTIYGETTKTENRVVSPQILDLTLTPFSPAKGIPNIYMIGNMNGWANSISDAVTKTFLMFRNDNNPDNMVYTYTGRIGADSYFKFCREDGIGDWTKMYCMGDNGTLTFGDLTAFHITDEGYYTITIDLNAMTYTIQPFDMTGVNEWPIMGFVGAFCNWGDGGSDPQMTPRTVKVNNGADIIDPHIWTWEGNLDNIDYGVKFRANHSWNDRWCPKVPTDNPYGVVVHNPTDQDNNIDISAQGLGNYFVVFNDLTGHYYVKLQQQ